MHVLFAIVLALVCSYRLSAGTLPLTAKDVGLMLRSGYSSEAVARDLATRHFVGPFDDAAKKMLVEAGATPALITALAKGTYAVPAEETARAQEALAAQSRRRAAEAEESRKFNTLYQDQLARARASAPAATIVPNKIYPVVKGDLVRWNNGSLVRFDDAILENKKVFGLYFSAYWCGPCRQFTPQLVEYYNRVAPQHPEFELIFVSADRSAFGFETYMRDMRMPWPAIDFAKVTAKDEIRKYAGEGIPCLVLIDSSGKVLSHSYAGKEYRGPAKVLSDLNTIFARGAASLPGGH
jgi:nucleoredoxin